MELMDAGNLKTISQSSRAFDENSVKDISICALNALEFVHQRFFIHRDVKLKNIMVNKVGSVKIGDLGLAVHYEKGQNLHHFAGTIIYSAPDDRFR